VRSLVETTSLMRSWMVSKKCSYHCLQVTSCIPALAKTCSMVNNNDLDVGFYRVETVQQ